MRRIHKRIIEVTGELDNLYKEAESNAIYKDEIPLEHAKLCCKYLLNKGFIQLGAGCYRRAYIHKDIKGWVIKVALGSDSSFMCNRREHKFARKYPKAIAYTPMISKHNTWVVQELVKSLPYVDIRKPGSTKRIKEIKRLNIQAKALDAIRYSVGDPYYEKHNIHVAFEFYEYTNASGDLAEKAYRNLQKTNIYTTVLALRNEIGKMPDLHSHNIGYRWYKGKRRLCILDAGC